MNLTTFLIAAGVFVSWGLGTFIAKLAANRIGSQSLFWDAIGATFVILIYSLIMFKIKHLIQADRPGVGLALLAGSVGAFGSIGFYILVTRTEVSTVSPLTALYPALTVILAIIFLRESVTPAKLIGIILSLIAIYLLSK